MYDLELIGFGSFKYILMDYFWEFEGFLRPPVKDRDAFLNLLRTRGEKSRGGAKISSYDEMSNRNEEFFGDLRYDLEAIGEDAGPIWRWIVLFCDSKVKGLQGAIRAWEAIFFEWIRKPLHIGGYLDPKRFEALQKAYRLNVSIPEKLADPLMEKRGEDWFELDLRSEWDELVHWEFFEEIGLGPQGALKHDFGVMLHRRFFLLSAGELTSEEHELLLKEAKLTDKMKKNGLYQEDLMPLPDLVALYPQPMRDAILVDKWTFGRKPQAKTHG